MNISFEKRSFISFFIIVFYEIFIKLKSIFYTLKIIYLKLLRHFPSIWIVYIPILEWNGMISIAHYNLTSGHNISFFNKKKKYVHIICFYIWYLLEAIILQCGAITNSKELTQRNQLVLLFGCSFSRVLDYKARKKSALGVHWNF